METDLKLSKGFWLRSLQVLFPSKVGCSFAADPNGESTAHPRRPSWISGGCFQTEKGGEWMREEKGGEGTERKFEGLDPHNVWNRLTPMVIVKHKQLAKVTQPCLLKTQFWLQLVHFLFQFCCACSKCRLLLCNLFNCSQFCSFWLLHNDITPVTSQHSYIYQQAPVSIYTHQSGIDYCTTPCRSERCNSWPFFTKCLKIPSKLFNNQLFKMQEAYEPVIMFKSNQTFNNFIFEKTKHSIPKTDAWRVFNHGTVKQF